MANYFVLSKHKRKIQSLMTACIMTTSVVTPAIATSPDDAPQEATLFCDIGGEIKNFANTEWIVYGCDGAATLILVSNTGNPAYPFYFAFNFDKEGTLSLVGEGTGNQNATKAVYEELSHMNPEQVVALMIEARNIELAKTADK